MNSKVGIIIVQIVILILCEVCAQINPRYRYSTETRYDNGRDTSFVRLPPPEPESEDDKDLVEAKRVQGSAVPLELIEKLNTIGNITEFFDEFIAKESIDSTEIIASRIGDENVERSLGVIAKPASCIPQTTVVPLEPINMSKDPTIIYFPQCTRVNRCGGCCSSPLLSCQPLETETITFLIYKSQYTGGNKMSYRGKEVVPVEQHTKCKCDCRIQEKDCNSYQVYDSSQCRCICTNYDELDKCRTESGKIWDVDNCRCRCRYPKECTSGTYFDERQCKCFEPVDTNQNPERTPLFDRKRFILKAIPVYPDNNTKYNTES